MNAISVRGLEKRYRGAVALDGVTLDIPVGSVCGLLGPNGAGKSTLFRCLLGLTRATTGDVTFYGRPLAPADFERVAFVPEQPSFYDWMTVAEHVEMNRRTFAAFDAEAAKSLLARFGVDDLRRRPRALSKGMQTATMVACAFARTPDLLVLDEPTSGLDPVNQRIVLNLIVDAAASGRTVVLSSHQIGAVERSADRVVMFDRGRIVMEGAIDDLKATRKIVEGIMPADDTPLDCVGADGRIAHLTRRGRIVRASVTSGASDVAGVLTEQGAQGVRVIDLDLEDMFLEAISPGKESGAVMGGDSK